MKILYIHNEYHHTGGEEHASRELASILTEHGHEVRWYTKSSKGIEQSLWLQYQSLWHGIYNSHTKKELHALLTTYHPDVAIVQNIYPIISSSVFQVLREHQIPVVMRCPNYRIFCPSGLCLDSQGKVCERCWSGFREYNCISHNCQKNIFKSIGYALRNAYNRISKKIINQVDCFIVQSEFQKNKFVQQGISPIQIGILPGVTPQMDTSTEYPLGEDVVFVGRVSPEKGIYELIQAAQKLPHIRFKVAGSIDETFQMPTDCPHNIEFVGFKQGDELRDIYINAQIVVVPSKWYEGFPNVILQAMMFRRPVITTQIGAMSSIIRHEENGWLVTPGHSGELADAISHLYKHPQLCNRIGKNGYQDAINLYSREATYNKLLSIIHQAIKNHQNHATR